MADPGGAGSPVETVVADTSSLVSLAVPGADSAYDTESGPDPLQYLLTSCTVTVPSEVATELSEMAQYSDLHGVAAGNVLAARDHYEVADPYDHPDASESRPAWSLDSGETDGVVLANAIGADVFLTDEFGSTAFNLVHAVLEGPRLVTTPGLICDYATAGHVSPDQARELVTFISDRRSWGANPYVQLLLDEL